MKERACYVIKIATIFKDCVDNKVVVCKFDTKLNNDRSSRPEVLCKKDFLKNFAKFTGKHLCHSLFFNKVAGLRAQACNFIKKETVALVFSYEFCEIFENTFFKEHPWTTASVMNVTNRKDYD